MGKFNPSRGTNNNTVNKISKMLQAGECDNMSQPLSVAIARNFIDPKCLVNNYDTATHQPALHVTKFTSPNPDIFVLSGAHRVLASRSASGAMRNSITKFTQYLEDDDDADDGDEDYEPNASPDVEASATDIHTDAISATEHTIETASTWPVHFYDIGKPRPRSWTPMGG